MKNREVMMVSAMIANADRAGLFVWCVVIFVFKQSDWLQNQAVHINVRKSSKAQKTSVQEKM